MSDRYLPDNEPRDILLSLEELAAKKLPHAPTFRKAADEITRLRADNEKLKVALDGYRKDAQNFLVRLDDLNILRTDLAAVTAERDRMRDALRPFADAVDIFIAEKHDAYQTIVTLGDFFHARAALEGVTEKSGAGNE